MLFSSIPFLYYFLPILLLIYFMIPNRFKNMVLLLFSLFFYFYGEPIYICILVGSCLINYIAGVWIAKYAQKKKSFYILIGAIFINIGLLVYFKYMDFMIQNWNAFLNGSIPLRHIAMPLGISFFTFQTISYIIDVWKGKVRPQTNFFTFATYVCLFPQLVAGPIVRYQTIAQELKQRVHNIPTFAHGIERFIIGLSKKVLLANVLGELCKCLCNLPQETILSNWFNAISYALQVYFDFSGYSDMAIGLGLMFGFHFLENFNYPYIASSITDFWRRWHISLSSWLKDYVYIPLGGSRCSSWKWVRNMIIVWFFTGFWHGASWNFILWGLYFAVVLYIEKRFLNSFLKKHRIGSHIYTLFIVVISFVIFNHTDLQLLGKTIQNLFGFGSIPLMNAETLYYGQSYFFFLILAFISATPIVKMAYVKIRSKFRFCELLEPFIWMALLIICTSYLVDASFNPFLYFRF